MKKKLIFYTLIFSILINTYAVSYTLEELNISEEYIGTYLPVDYQILLNQFKSHEKAMDELRRTHYTVIMPTKEGCYSDLRYLDRFCIESEIIKQWKFKNLNTIIDENGHEYKKISNKSFSYKAIANYTLTSLFSDYISDTFKIIENYLIINNESYKLHLNPSYTSDDVAVFLQNKTPYFIRFKNKKLQLVKGKVNDEFCMQFDPTDEVIYECEEK